MALFKISKGLKTNLPSSKTDGWCYFTTDDGKFWIDYKDTDNALKRKAVNAAYADAATKATQDSSGNNIVNTYATKTALKSVSDLVGSTSVSSQITNAIASKADKTHTHNYAGSSSAGGSATSAVKLDSSAGDANTPVYFSGGKPAACTSLDLDTSGNAASASKVANALTIQGNGTTLTNGTFDGSAAKTVNITPSSIGAAASSHTHNYAGSSSAGGPADYLKVQSSNEINFKGLTKQTRVHFNYRNADTNTSATNYLITGYYFDNKSGNTKGVTLYADNFSGTAAKATSDGSGNNIVNTYATKTALKSVSDLVGSTSVATQVSNALTTANTYTDNKVASLVDSAPETLNTLNELAAALGDDANFATTIANQIGKKADANHTHKYAGSSSAGGAANSVANSMTVQLNGGTTEGTNKFTFNGSAAKSVNITPSGIGAAAASHSHSQYELLTNKINQWTASTPSETAYPTEKLVKTALDGKANTGQKTTNSAGGHSHSLTVPVASITTEGTAASYTGHSFNAGSGSFTASVDANGVLSFSHTHTAPTHSIGTFSPNKPTKISITDTNYTTNSIDGHTHSITI